jgi:pimeloyl-ACP methyl ester carboxylesterase
MRKYLPATLAVALVTVPAMAGSDVFDRVEHGDADSGGVKIHYASLGEGPLVVMIHGFPDFWYTWRDQMEALSGRFRVVAIDLRGYNRSDRPEGVEQYAMPLLVGDVAAVIRHLGEESAIIVGHDWGGAVAWSFALSLPRMTERLVILNLPHPNGLFRELRSNPRQHESSAYARAFQEKGPDDPDVFFGGPMTPQTLSSWVLDPEARKRYVEAFERSDFTAMLNYYKANYPRTSPGDEAPERPPLPKATMPVLMFHGLDDQALLPGALNDTWEWLEKDLTLVTIPGAGHFVQQDAGELVTRTMTWWLSRDSDEVPEE